jgi:hypothetical protein
MPTYCPDRFLPSITVPAFGVSSLKRLRSILHTYEEEKNAPLYSIAKVMLQAWHRYSYVVLSSRALPVSMALPAHTAIFMNCSDL